MKDTMKKVSTVATSPDYERVDCPGGGPKSQCDALNVWGAAWEAWGVEVVAELRRLGGGTPTAARRAPAGGAFRSCHRRIEGHRYQPPAQAPLKTIAPERRVA